MKFEELPVKLTNRKIAEDSEFIACNDQTLYSRKQSARLIPVSSPKIYSNS